MSIATAVVLVVVGGVIIANNTPEARERRRKEMKERFEKHFEPMRKRCEKRRFITNFIDEIPELSYHEAAQLKKKLGNIYVEWNDE
jgi:hypothetical protein